ncbi:DUF4047 domain-containing protein [Halobacillus sp. A1]|uniref:DUF4047 domain-containing protein n=1 Tax=Halobacillus sp. A1 TaxID=2880262 RepID=UPI0020A6BE04|nr:DUF4047 domain-containing protein [Halobacillus sp. A1]MCP3032053.1 DUF4047 domain-containing protein [Halobacillus sp. A1]
MDSRKRKPFKQLIMRMTFLSLFVGLSSQLVSETEAAFLSNEKETMSITTADIFPQAAEETVKELEQNYDEAYEIYKDSLDKPINYNTLDEIAESKQSLTSNLEQLIRLMTEFNSLYEEIITTFKNEENVKVSLRKANEIYDKSTEIELSKIEKRINQLMDKEEDLKEQEKQELKEQKEQEIEEQEMQELEEQKEQETEEQEKQELEEQKEQEIEEQEMQELEEQKEQEIEEQEMQDDKENKKQNEQMKDEVPDGKDPKKESSAEETSTDNKEKSEGDDSTEEKDDTADKDEMSSETK